MNRLPAGPTMRQKIFSMNLSVEAVSVYLLCCAIADAGGVITRQALEEKWNAGSEELNRELDRLEARQVLGREGSVDQDAAVYRLRDEKHWR
jgi:hypothetical protein